MRGGTQPQTSQTTLERRIAAVVELLAQGGTCYEVLALAAEDWGMSVRSADRLLMLARNELNADWQIERPELLAQLISSLSELQQHARKT
ncbi:hypothetical protein [Cyanobium sp. N5-Cardenillas]|uniref:hypothetical protein n=1 Tax=Cyanobium sp. N5-Cardenillas TaxID=2823720 RepID=UPI0020CD8C7F|nr:hypothetical protein [Cyanobium sp. N5-Cardenillas]MCP9787205.1 hypothetical protein [Cyanobium sp. N5-Cardenillas]